MNHYYLISQLPSLDAVGDTTPLPITEEQFEELCERFLGKKPLDRLKKITLVPPRTAEKTGSSLLDAWCKGERQLRLALGRFRAERMGKQFDAGDEPFSMTLLQTARTAAGMRDPMAAEIYLTRYRLDILEELRPADAFSEDMLLYYGLKLKLLTRIRLFDEKSGARAYKTIYDSILHGAETEVVQ